MGLSNNLSLLKDIETGARGFALTGISIYRTKCFGKA
jgi:CHASE3 domain sensor protein